jgi:probable phosphoglycerate mutase
VQAQRPGSITLLRHAESDWNEHRLVQGHNDEPRLVEAGRAHARAVARSLAGTFDRIIASDLRRAIETAEIVRAGASMPIEVDSRLRERCFGALEGGPLASLTPDVTGIREGIVVDDHARAPGGESLDELAARAGEALGALRSAADGANVLVVTHGGTIRALRARAGDIAMVGLVWDAVGNCTTWPLDVAAAG